MTLADFFLAINNAGIRMAHVRGQLQLRGPASTITPEIKAGAAEHKTAILNLLPMAAEPEHVTHATEQQAIAWEGTLKSSEAVTVARSACATFQEIINADAWKDQVAVKQLVRRVFTILDTVGFSEDNAILRRQQMQTADRIDDRYLAKDLPGFHETIDAFIGLFAVTTDINVDSPTCPGCEFCSPEFWTRTTESDDSFRPTEEFADALGASRTMIGTLCLSEDG